MGWDDGEASTIARFTVSCASWCARLTFDWMQRRGEAAEWDGVGLPRMSRISRMSRMSERARVWFQFYLKRLSGMVQVKLGLLPGWGGTQLVHPLVGLQAALDMILTGEEKSLTSMLG